MPEKGFVCMTDVIILSLELFSDMGKMGVEKVPRKRSLLQKFSDKNVHFGLDKESGAIWL